LNEPGNQERRPPERKPRGTLTILLVVGLAATLLVVFGNYPDRSEEVTWTEFTAQLDRGPGTIKSLVYRREEANFEGVWGPRGKGKEDTRFLVRVPNPKEFITPELERKIDLLLGSRYEVKDPSRFWSYLIPLLPWVILIFLFWFIFIRQMRNPGGPSGVLSFGKSRARMHSKEHVSVTFDDVAGIEEAKEEVAEIIAFLRNPTRFQRLGGRVPKGVLLVGSPGTGKTLLAKAIAGEADVPFFSISGSDFVEMFVGVGASRVRDLFKQARENSPCIIFLDEIDAVGRRRGAGLGGGHDEREQTLNAILVEMDGFDTDEGIIILASTNRPDILDPALLRPGRFDRQVVVDMPDLRGREGILRVHARNVKLSPDVDLGVIARGTPGFSGADLAAVMNEAALLATMKDKHAVETEDLEEARDKVKWGRQKRSVKMEQDDRRITAYHESGHAIVAHNLPDAEPLHKVTIIPRGMALGATMQLPERDRYHMSKKRLYAMMTVLFGGRVAEEIFCGDVTSGAQNDIERATEIARRMVTEWGMSERIGPVNYRENEEHLFLGHEVTKTKNHSEQVAEAIDEEVKAILSDCYDRARKVLEDHRAETEALANALLRYEALSGAEVAAIFRGDTVEAFRKAKKTPAAENPARKPADVPEVGEDEADDLESKGRFAY
jgi:cell division protease FtsH